MDSNQFETLVTKMYCFSALYYDKQKKESWDLSAWNALNKAPPDKAAGKFFWDFPPDQY